MNNYESGDASRTIQISEKRSCTNIFFIIAFIACCLLMIPLIIYFVSYNDIKQLIYGFDKYGNICGKKNVPIDGINCSGKDMTEKSIALIRYVPVNACLKKSVKKILPFECVEKCEEPNQLIFHRCYPPVGGVLDDLSRYYKLMTEIFHALSEYWLTIFTMIIASLGCTLLVLSCMKFQDTLTVFWIILIFQIMFSLITASIFWNKYSNSTEKSIIYLLFTVISVIYVTFIISYLFLFHDFLLNLNILYEDATKAVFAMPILLLKSVAFFVIFAVCILAASFLIIVILSKHFFQNDHQETLSNFSDSLTAVGYIFFLALWIYGFLEGFQAISIAGCIIRYYFANDSTDIKDPIKKSLRLVLRYHLGTVACSSIILTLTTQIRTLMEFTLRKIYITTVLYGSSFEKSCLHFWYLLKKNLFYLIALIGFHFILISGIVLLVTLIGIGFGIVLNLNYVFDRYSRLSFGIGAIFASFAVMFFLQVLNVTVDTFFVLSCEEKFKETKKIENATNNF